MRTLACGLIATYASAMEVLSHKFTEFGTKVHEIEPKGFDSHTHVTKNPEAVPFQMDYEAQANNLEILTDSIRNYKLAGESNYEETEPIYTCFDRNPSDDRAAGALLPIYTGDLGPRSTSASFTGRCFDFDIEYAGVVDDLVTLNVTTSNKKSLACEDTLLFANTEYQHLEMYLAPGHHKITFELGNQDAEEDFAFGGVKVFQFCGGAVDEAMSLFHTLEAFVGGLTDHTLWPWIGSHTPPYMEKANLDFIRESMGLTFEEREIYDTGVPEDFIQSGDFFLIMRLDGLDPIIMYGTGSHGAHCVMAMRDENNELWIVESQDAWYWPTANIQKTPYKKWIEQAKEASFNVIWLPLNGQAMTRFDQKAAWEWFDSVEGLPYGYHNFLFGWIDTERSNLPPILPDEFSPVLFAMLDNVIPGPVNTMFIQGLNKRLGTDYETIPEIAAAAAEREMSIQDVMAIPEQDGWIYSGLEPRDGQAYVCSAFTAGMYKAAGMFPHMEVQATEFTPRDNYVLDFFDKSFKRPKVCEEADPGLPYCQLIGKYRMDITAEWSTVTPYSHMNEHCPTVNPTYDRPYGC